MAKKQSASQPAARFKRISSAAAKKKQADASSDEAEEEDDVGADAEMFSSPIIG